jgi:hypothetical protein
MAGDSQNLALNPGEVVTAWKEWRNEPAFYIGVRRPEYPENPASYSIVINWRVRIARGVALAIDETDSDTYADLQLITAEQDKAIQSHPLSQRSGRMSAGQRAAMTEEERRGAVLTDEDRRQGRGAIGLTDHERDDLRKRGGVPPLTPEERAQEKVTHGQQAQPGFGGANPGQAAHKASGADKIPTPTGPASGREGGANPGQTIHHVEGTDKDPTPQVTSARVPEARNPPAAIHGAGPPLAVPVDKPDKEGHPASKK